MPLNERLFLLGRNPGLHKKTGLSRIKIIGAGMSILENAFDQFGMYSKPGKFSIEKFPILQKAGEIFDSKSNEKAVTFKPGDYLTGTFLLEFLFDFVG